MLLPAFFLLLSLNSWGQTGSLVEDFFQRFEKEMAESFKDFENLFNHDKQQAFPKHRSFWRETKTERILVLKVSTPEGTPLDINIKNGQIVIKATVEEKRENHGPRGKSISKSIYRFQKGPFPIPKDVDSEKVQVEKQKDEILIRFPKTAQGQEKIKKTRPATRPLPMKKGDLKI